MSRRPVVVVGDVVTDVLAVLEGPLAVGSDVSGRVRSVGGGAGGNVAAWLAELGVTVSLVGRIGDDDAGRARQGELAAAGVRTLLSVDDVAPTGTVVVLVDRSGERSMVPDRGANARLQPGDLPEDLLGTPGHLHLSAYPLLDPRSGPVARSMLTRARVAGWTTSVDPASTAPLQTYGVDRFRAAVAGVDLLLPNAEEARVLAGVDDPAVAARLLAGAHRAVVVSCGAAGAVWAGVDPGGGPSGGAVAAVVGPVHDTTGAGDAFTAGVLSAWVAGASLADCADAGVTVAARVVARPGARPVPGGVSPR